MNDLPLFVGALAVAYLLPGPDMLLLIQTGAAQGRGRALAAAVGLGAARATHVALAAAGLAALLHNAPALFAAVRLCGAAYLVWVGIGILRAPSLVPQVSEADAPGHRQPVSALALRGLLTNLLNPKALLFCSVLLPQFVHAERGALGVQFALLGAVLVGTGALFDAAYALAGAGLGRLLRRHPLVQAVQRWLFATLLMGFGARLAVSR